MKTLFFLVSVSLAPVVFAGLVVTKIAGPPVGDTVKIQQLERDETGPTSFRFYAAREGAATKTDEWVYIKKDGEPDGTLARYYFRDRDLGQTFRTESDGFRLSAITVRLQPVDVHKADPAGAKVSIQILKVHGKPRINDNGTNAKNAPNGTSVYALDSARFGTRELLYPDDRTAYVNPQWSTYASDWPFDPADFNEPRRWPTMYYSDDFIEGERYEHLALISGGVVPDGLSINDYMRWEVTGEDQLKLDPNTRYAFLFLFDEAAPAGANRNIPLSNKNVIPGGRLADPYPEGHAIRRDGSSTRIEDVFIYDLDDPADVEASRRSATFPEDISERLAIQPGTLGYPDVDTYRDLYFIIEGY